MAPVPPVPLNRLRRWLAVVHLPDGGVRVRQPCGGLLDLPVQVWALLAAVTMGRGGPVPPSWMDRKHENMRSGYRLVNRSIRLTVKTRG
jgi:hypothetical protein